MLLTTGLYPRVLPALQQPCAALSGGSENTNLTSEGQRGSYFPTCYPKTFGYCFPSLRWKAQKESEAVRSTFGGSELSLNEEKREKGKMRFELKKGDQKIREGKVKLRHNYYPCVK